MKPINFNAFKEISASEELITRTIAAAEQMQDEKTASAVVLPLSLRRRLAIAASIVLVSVIGATTYFLFGNMSDHPIAVGPVLTGTEAATEFSTDSEPSVPSGVPTDPTVQSTAVPTEPAFPSTAEPTKPVSTTYATVPEPTQPTPPTAPQPSSATERDDPQPVEPTVPIDPPVVDPSDITDPPAVDPTWAEYPSEPQLVIVHGKFPADQLTDSGKVYCALFDSSDNRIGDCDLFAEMREAVITLTRNGTSWVKYLIPEGLLTKSDLYTVVFYNEAGILLCTSTNYISID